MNLFGATFGWLMMYSYIQLSFVYSTTFICNSGNNCYGQTLICLDGEDCTLECGYPTLVCAYSTFNCPNDGTCYVKVISVNSGLSMTVNGNNAISLTVETGLTTSMQLSTINCPNNGGDCNINLSSGAGNCYKCNINANNNNLLSILAPGPGVLADATIDASGAKKLYVNARGHTSFYDADIYCPSDQSTQGQCEFYVFFAQLSGLTIYAVEGLNDLTITPDVRSQYTNQFTVLCGNNYDSLCSADYNSVTKQIECDPIVGDGTFCQGFTVTNEPTEEPTQEPLPLP